MTESVVGLMTFFLGGGAAAFGSLFKEDAQRAVRSLYGGIAIALAVCLVMALRLPPLQKGECYPAPTLAKTPASTQTPSPVASQTTTVVLAETSFPTPSVTPELTLPFEAGSDSQAIALQAAGIFAAPDANSQHLGGVHKGESVAVLARSAYGQWFYIRDDVGVEGFVYAPWFQWSGDVESLPVTGPTTMPPTVTAINPSPPPPPLEMDLWDLDGTESCSSAMWRKSVYIAGRGGNGVYTYFWNGEPVAGPLSEGYSFEVHSVDAAIIGTGKVVSGDGQEVERALHVPVPSCFN